MVHVRYRLRAATSRSFAWAAVLALVVPFAGDRVAGQDAPAAVDGPTFCAPRLVRTDEPRMLDWRLAAIRDPGHRYAFRTPYVEGAGCPAEAEPTSSTPRPGVAWELIAVGGLEHNEVRYARGGGALVEAATRDNRVAPGGSARGWWAARSWLEISVEASTLGAEAELREAAALWVAGPLYGWVGRRAVGYGTGAGGSIVLSGGVPLDGVGLGVRRPFRLPWLLKWLGEWDFEVVGSRASDNGDVGNPLFGAARGTWSPFRGITFGTTRAAMAHGDGAPGLTGRRLWSTIIGSHLEEEGRRLQFNNQIMTLDAVVRARIAGVPWALYAELGAEDSAGAWVDSPSIMAGLEMAHPSRGWLVGFNHAYMHPINGHGYFYRHGLYGAGWSDEGRGLGHPLGGPGREWQVHGASTDFSGRWDVEAGLFVRDRYEGNSLGPALQGRTTGVRINGRAAVGSFDLFARAEAERHESGLDRVVGSFGMRWTRGGIR